MDAVADQYWYQDVGKWNNDEYMSTRQTIDATLNGSASSYQSDSWGDWRMADMTDMENLWGNSNYDEIKGLFIGSQRDISVLSGVNTYYITGRFDSSYDFSGTQTHRTAHLHEYNPGGLESLSDLTGGGWVFDTAGLDYIGAWVVADAAPVPEPTTMLLFGTGLVGLVGSRLRKKKK